MDNYKDILNRNLDEFDSEYDMYEDAENEDFDEDFELIDLDDETLDGYQDDYSDGYEEDIYRELIDRDKPMYGYNEDEWD